MQISLSKFSMFLAGLVSLGCIMGVGYLLFTIFFTGPVADQAPVLTLANVRDFGPKLQKASAILVDPTSKIALNKNKDLQFLISPLFLSFTENPVQIELSKSRGRPDPFVPYVAP